jgi:hypothetical protein
VAATQDTPVTLNAVADAQIGKGPEALPTDGAMLVGAGGADLIVASRQRPPVRGRRAHRGGPAAAAAGTAALLVLDASSGISATKGRKRGLTAGGRRSRLGIKED